MKEKVLQDLCPITLDKLPSNPLDVAYIWSDHNAIHERSPKYGCGHKCSLRALIGYINNGDQHPGIVPPCPVCFESPVLAICDGVVANELLQTEKPSANLWKLFQICYCKQTYWLAVNATTVKPFSSFFLWNMDPKKSFQGRICQALQLDERYLKFCLTWEEVWCIAKRLHSFSFNKFMVVSFIRC